MVNRLDSMARRAATADRALTGSVSRLSSGRRIVTAADDAAGLSISERLRAQTGGVVRAQRNVADAVGVIQTADGALAEVAGILQRTRELAVRHAHGSLSATDREALRREAGQLGAEVTRLGRATNFNGTGLLDGSRPGLVVQVGGRDGDELPIALASLSAIVGDDVFDFLATGTTASTGSGGATGTGGSSGGSSDPSTPPPGSGSGSSGSGGDGWSFSWGGWTWTWNGSAWSRSRASSGGGTAPTTGGGSGTGGTTTAPRNAAIGRVDDAINAVSAARGILGASQSRLEFIASKLAAEGEHLTSAESRIRDADMAAEVVSLTRNQIRGDVSRAMTAQARVQAQNALRLLVG